ncbi:MAG: GvpL/GvpF family gas vesicle protein, partial [bacterium]
MTLTEIALKLYAYAIIDSNSGTEEPLIGLDGVSVYTIPYRGIGIVVSDLEAHFEIKTEESILKHEEVVEALMEKFTVLPMRLYTVFSGKEEMLLKMKDHYEDFIKNMDRVYNKCEFGIKVIWAGNVIKKRIAIAHKPKGNGLASDSQSHKNENVSAQPGQSGTKFM